MRSDFQKIIFDSISTTSASEEISSSKNFVQKLDTARDGKTYVLAELDVQLPHHKYRSTLKVKLDMRAEANILPLRTYKKMFPHQLLPDGTPDAQFLKKTTLDFECNKRSTTISHENIQILVLISFVYVPTTNPHLCYVSRSQVSYARIITHWFLILSINSLFFSIGNIIPVSTHPSYLICFLMSLFIPFVTLYWWILIHFVGAIARHVRSTRKISNIIFGFTAKWYHSARKTHVRGTIFILTPIHA